MDKHQEIIYYERGKPYCTANCAREDCAINLTQEVEDQAEEEGLPIFFTNYQYECEDFEEIK